MTVNTATLNLITEFEGVELEAYADPAHGWAVPTIGVGHTSAAGPPKVVKGMKITRKEAMEILARDLAGVETTVTSAVKVPLNENQFGALVSFTFNLGAGNLRKSTLLRLLNAKDYAGAAGQFGQWVKAKGKKLDGLVRRREAERALFLTPVAEKAVQPPAPPMAPFPPTPFEQPPQPASVDPIPQPKEPAMNTPDVKVVDVKSAWLSKINWTQFLGLAAMLATMFGIPVTDELKAQLIAGITGLTYVVTWALRTFFSNTITPASANKL
jgi:lysozyme